MTKEWGLLLLLIIIFFLLRSLIRNARITAALPNFFRKLSIARSAWAERRSSMSESSAWSPGAAR